MLEKVKLKQVSEIVELLQNNFTPDSLIEVQRNLAKAVECVDSMPTGYARYLNGKHEFKSTISAELRSAIEKNKQAHDLLLQVCDILQNVSLSLRQIV